MFKGLIMLSVVLVVSGQTRTTPKFKEIPIVSHENILEVDGKFRYSYEGGDGTRAIQDGQQIFVNNQAGTASQGQYTYQGDDGKTYSVSYTADENGYRPSADHLPTPPPVPAPIARALAYLATLPPQKENNNNNHNNNFNGNANKNNNRKF
ncbi:hypothetical protein pipiens_002990 [Culex pipiens pipiens]|uniref:Endocuticle structural glycoprotein SgAbd-3 n=2 Tax=Culex pipiens TaxID=7175 RepID=A0A8D8ND42_CULPI